MPALQKFLQAELHKRDWSIETFARRVPMSVSRGYQIVNEGQDNVRQDMFDRIAAALDLTSADLAARTGSGVGELNAHDLEWLDVGRLIPLEERPTWVRMVRAATNTSGEGTANGPGSRNNGRRKTDTPPFQSQKHGRVAAFAVSVFASIVRPQRVFALPSAATT